MAYMDMPGRFVFDKETTKWRQRKKRQKGEEKEPKTIGRMYTVSPQDPER